MKFDKKIPHANLATADQTEKGSYTRIISEDERKAVQATIVHLMHEEGRLADEKAEVANTFKGRAKQLKERKADMLKQDRTGEVVELDTLSTFFDHETGTAGIYNSKGDLVNTRPMTYDERQLEIPGIVKMRAAANE